MSRYADTNLMFIIKHRFGIPFPSLLLYCSHLQTVLCFSVPREYFNTIMTAHPDIQYNAICIFMYRADKNQEHIVSPVLRNEQNEYFVGEGNAWKINWRWANKHIERINGIWKESRQEDLERKHFREERREWKEKS